MRPLVGAELWHTSKCDIAFIAAMKVRILGEHAEKLVKVSPRDQNFLTAGTSIPRMKLLLRISLVNKMDGEEVYWDWTLHNVPRQYACLRSTVLRIP